MSAIEYMDSSFVKDNIERLIELRLEEREFKGLEKNEFSE